MDDWLNEELERLGIVRTIPYQPQKLGEIYDRMDDEGSIAIEVARIKAAIEHDDQNIEALTMILKMNRKIWGKSEEIKVRYPLLHAYVEQLYDVLEVVTQRKPTTSMMLRKYVQDNSDTT